MNRNLHDIKNIAGAAGRVGTYSKTKQNNLLTRRVYLNELSGRGHPQDKHSRDESYRKYHSSSRNVIKDFNLNLSKNKYATHAN